MRNELFKIVLHSHTRIQKLWMKNSAKAVCNNRPRYNYIYIFFSREFRFFNLHVVSSGFLLACLWRQFCFIKCMLDSWALISDDSWSLKIQLFIKLLYSIWIIISIFYRRNIGFCLYFKDSIIHIQNEYLYVKIFSTII